MRQLSRHRTTIVSAFLAGLLLALAVLPALAKEGLLVTFDAPIAMGTPGGTKILVGMMVTVPDGDVTHPVEGSPIYLRIFGPDKAFTEASGRVDDTPGHYTMSIAIPEGGARRVEVVIRGTTDLPIMLANDPLTFGGITAWRVRIRRASATRAILARRSAVGSAKRCSLADRKVPILTTASTIAHVAGPAVHVHADVHHCWASSP